MKNQTLIITKTPSYSRPLDLPAHLINTALHLSTARARRAGGFKIKSLINFVNHLNFLVTLKKRLLLKVFHKLIEPLWKKASPRTARAKLGGFKNCSSILVIFGDIRRIKRHTHMSAGFLKKIARRVGVFSRLFQVRLAKVKTPPHGAFRELYGLDFVPPP